MREMKVCSPLLSHEAKPVRPSVERLGGHIVHLLC